jgi:hypothetical protein
MSLYNTHSSEDHGRFEGTYCLVSGPKVGQWKKIRRWQENVTPHRLTFRRTVLPPSSCSTTNKQENKDKQEATQKMAVFKDPTVRTSDPTTRKFILVIKSLFQSPFNYGLWFSFVFILLFLRFRGLYLLSNLGFRGYHTCMPRLNAQRQNNTFLWFCSARFLVCFDFWSGR